MNHVSISALLAVSALLFGCGGGVQASPPAAKPPAATEAPAAAKPAKPAKHREPGVLPVTADMGSPHPGDPAPDFELVDQHGQPFRLSELTGSVVVLSFTASWCPFSKAEQPHLAKLPEQYADQNVKFVVVDIDETPEQFQQYLGRVEMPMPVLHDQDGAVARSYSPPGAQPSFKDRARAIVTSNLVIDEEGVIRFFALLDTQRFDAKFEHLRRTLDELLAKANP